MSRFSLPKSTIVDFSGCNATPKEGRHLSSNRPKSSKIIQNRPWLNIHAKQLIFFTKPLICIWSIHCLDRYVGRSTIMILPTQTDEQVKKDYLGLSSFSLPNHGVQKTCKWPGSGVDRGEYKVAARIVSCAYVSHPSRSNVDCRCRVCIIHYYSRHQRMRGKRSSVF